MRSIHPLSIRATGVSPLTAIQTPLAGVAPDDGRNTRLLNTLNRQRDANVINPENFTVPV
jgi:hypothetical protein